MCAGLILKNYHMNLSMRFMSLLWKSIFLMVSPKHFSRVDLVCYLIKEFSLDKFEYGCNINLHSPLWLFLPFNFDQFDFHSTCYTILNLVHCRSCTVTRLWLYVLRQDQEKLWYSNWLLFDCWCCRKPVKPMQKSFIVRDKAIKNRWYCKAVCHEIN